MTVRIVFGLFCIALLLSTRAAECQSPIARTPRTEAAQLKHILQQKHISPPSINDDFSERVFTLLIAELDPESNYLTGEEFEKLAAFRNKLDDEINGAGWSFLPIVNEVYKQSLTRCEKLIVSVTESAVSSSVKLEAIDTIRATNIETHGIRWHALLKADILQELAHLRVHGAGLSEKDFFTKNESIIRTRVRMKYQRQLQRLLHPVVGFENYVSNLYLQCIAHAFDPHSSYMPLTEMENFMSQLSTEGYYFGIGIDENDNGEIQITNLKPGGPAWKSGEIHAGDVIEKVRWTGEEWTETAGMEREELDDILRESNHNTLELSLKNATQGSHIVKLRKEKLQSDDNMVRGFLLTGKRKIGYISLPDFYSEWGETEGSRCANDVAKEIIKLKRENIEGLILDLRFNGGGSLEEASAMAGTFIEAGPMGVIQARGEEPVTMKDENRGTVYDGPLVVLVNSISASASEFLAAALQDYRRAIIVGADTYGKATGQLMYALTPGKSEINYDKLASPGGWGFTSVTLIRIYRITGKSLQKNGVRVDIKLPDLYDLAGYRESLLPYALLPDSSNKKTYYTPLKKLPLESLRLKSATRVASDSAFISLTNYMSDFKQSIAEPSQTLQWNDLVKRTQQAQLRAQAMTRELQKPTSDFNVSSSNDIQTTGLWDEYAKVVDQAWVKNISTDPSLEEAFNILCDYISILNPK